MATTVTEPVFVDGTFQAGNIIYGRTLAPSGAANSVRSVSVTFGSGGAPAFTAGSGAPVVVVTAYSQLPNNRTLNDRFSNVTVSSVTSSGFTINVHRMDTDTTWVFWMAVRNP